MKHEYEDRLKQAPLHKTGRQTLKIPAIEMNQHGHKIYLGKIRVKPFMENVKWKVDKWTLEQLTKQGIQGYQRKLVDKHAGEFANFIKNDKNFSPSSFYVNVRPQHTKFCKIGVVSPEGFTTLTFDTELTLYVVDGQHRLAGIRDMMDWSLDPDIELSFHLTHGLSKQEEIEQFITMNKTQANVKTDLAEMSISQMVIHNPKLLAELAGKGNIIFDDVEFLQDAYTVLRALYTDKNSVWYDRILMPNQSKEKGSSIGVSTKSFTDSLKDLLKTHLPRTQKKVSAVPLVGVATTDVADHLQNYWNAMRDINKEMFQSQNVCKFAIQQTIGTMVMHKVLYLMHLNSKDPPHTLLKLSKNNFKALLDIKALKQSNSWDREYDDTQYRKDFQLGPRQPGERPTGGHYTRQGTNQKSFGLMAKEIFGQVQRGKEWEKYKKIIP